MIEIDGLVQYFIISRRLEILRQSIDDESMAVYLLGIVNRVAGTVEHPVRTAVFLINEVSDEIIVYTMSNGEIFRVVKKYCSCRKCPKGPGHKDQTPWCGPIHDELVGYPAVDTTPLLIYRV
ncbi:hypothetical protein ES703_55169 [subsurface metagenome]